MKVGLAFYTVSATVSKPEDYEACYKKIWNMGLTDRGCRGLWLGHD